MRPQKFPNTLVSLEGNTEVPGITSWERDGETVETVPDFILLGSKITADSEGSHEIKRRLLLGRKVMTNPESIFEGRDITLPTLAHFRFCFSTLVGREVK